MGIRPGESAKPWVAATQDELLTGATDRVPVRSADAKSGATFERLTLEGRPCFVKVLSARGDWIMRVTGNTTYWEYQVWRAGLYQQVPAVIDHAVIGMALEGTGPDARLSILMHDRTPDLVPPGDEPVPLAHHLGFLDHLAAFHAAFLGWRDSIGLQDLARRFVFFAPSNIAEELTHPDIPTPLAVADRGWRLLADRSPRLYDLVTGIHDRPDALAEALRTTPLTFVAGDWKFGNLGRRPDGRTVLLDWAYPGEAPPLWDLTWYLAINAARLPQSKEAAIEHYRARLAAHGVDTGGWWDRQLGLSLVAMAAVFGWEKAAGAAAELAWWERAALDGARWL